MRSLGAGSTTSAIYGVPIAGQKADWTAEAVIQAFLKRASQPPTVEQYRTSIKFAFESWPQAVWNLSIKSCGFQTTVDERDYLTSIAGECSPGSGLTEEQAMVKFREISRHPMFHQIADKCQQYIDRFETPPFFKFGTRSPKDSPYFHEFNGRVPTGGAVLCNIATSWRAFEDLAISQIHAGEKTAGQSMGLLKIVSLDAPKDRTTNHLPWIWFREYKPFKPWQEFRCFMKNREFMGATQYYGIEKQIDGTYVKIEAFQDLVDRGYEYEVAIKRFFEEKFLPATEGYCQGCVFDVGVDLEKNEVTLIEINPADSGTFPGFMDWRDLSSFDGTLKWAEASYLPDSGVIHIQAEDLHAQMQKNDQ